MTSINKKTPLEYLAALLHEATLVGIVTEAKIAEVLSDAARDPLHIQLIIDKYKFEVDKLTNKRVWVLAYATHDLSLFERIDDQSQFSSYIDATTACKVQNTQNRSGVRCRVVEVGKTVPLGLSKGRSVDDLIRILHPFHGSGYLDLQGKGIKAADMVAIIQLCCEFPLITQLGLSHNYFGPSGGKILATSYLPKHIVALFISENNLQDEGASLIADIVKRGDLPNLSTLGLNKNSITDKGACALAAAFDCTVNLTCNLEVIGLSNNKLTCIGACAIATSVLTSLKLRRLFFNENRDIGNHGGHALIRAALHHTSLLRLGLSHCGLHGTEIALALLGIMEVNPIIERICVCGNSFDPALQIRMKKCPRLNFHLECGKKFANDNDS